jgi:hypothetical protein
MPDSENKWVVLIYLAATSPELREIMERDLEEMATRLRLFDRNRAPRVYALMDTPAGKYAVCHALHPVETTYTNGIVGRSEPLTRIAPLNKDRARTLGSKGAYLADLIEWRFADEQKALSKLDHTLLILWGHSQGVASALSRPGSPAYAMVGNGGFGLDHLSGDSLTLPEIRRAIADGLKDRHDSERAKKKPSGEPGDPKTSIDILSFDSCFMSAAEVAAEFQREPPDPAHDADPKFDSDPETEPIFEEEPLEKGKERAEQTEKSLRRLCAQARKDENEPAFVDYVIASQTAVLLDGLDYGRLVDAFIDADSEQAVSPLQLGRRLLEQACSGDRSPVSLTLINTHDREGYVPFADAFEAMVKRLGEILDTATTRPSRRGSAERLRQRRRFTVKGRFLANEGASRSEWLRIRDAFEASTWHQVRQFIDVGDLCRRLANNSRDEALRTAALNVLQLLRPTASENCPQSLPLVVDVRSAHPLVFSGLSLYCPWLFPTPDQARNGAWNAIVDPLDYATGLWFNRRPASWGAFLYHAKHIIEESRQRAINTEIADLRSGSSCCRHGGYSGSAATSSARHLGGDKSGGNGFNVAEREDKSGGNGFNVAEPDEPAGLAVTSSLVWSSPRFRPEAADIAASRRLDSTTHVPISLRSDRG